MTDKVTIERATLEQAIDALECSLNDSRPYIVKSRESAAALRAALAAQPAEPVALDNACMTEQAIDEYLSDYTMEGDSGSHTPDESELLVIKDAIMGLLVYPDFLASFAQSDPAAVPLTNEMDKVASRYAHKMALDLECILAEYGGSWYNTAMQTLGEYRSAMNAIHERESPTFMGEPVIAAAAGDKP